MDLIAIVIILIVSATTFKWSYRRFTHPPLTGPPRWPIVGNLFQIPVHKPWVAFAEWKKQYGDFIPLTIFGRRLFVLNSREAAVDLLEKRSAIYSDRPRRAMTDLCGFGKSAPFQAYGSSFRKARKLMHTELSQVNAQHHSSIQQQELLLFITRISQFPQHNLAAETRRLASSVILAISYGYQVKGSDDYFISLAEKVMSYLERVVAPNNYLIDSLPILRYIPEWMPGAGFKKEARQCRELLYRMVSEPYGMVVSQMQNGGAMASLVSRNLEDSISQMNEEDSETLMWTAGGLFAAGSHTTAATIMFFFQTMLIYPHVQKRAQAELDVIVKEGRLPNLTDRPSLPYIDCIIQELLRWRPAVPIGKSFHITTAHSSLSDDVYRGVHIPAGSVNMINIWALTHDEDVYESPEDFNPDRFLSKDTPDPRLLVFGFGRRSCPGNILIDNFIWMIIATALSTMDILPPVDEDGKEIIPSTEYTSGAVIHPPPFNCRIIPRTKNSMDLISDAITAMT
ncbi:cytochrome P450 [Agrocybe pediades]|nr:cytochrome P450 [Agrocybe pediades]